MARFVIFSDKQGQFRWRLVARNGEIVAASEAYVSKENAERSARRVKELAPIAQIIDEKMVQFIARLLKK